MVRVAVRTVALLVAIGFCWQAFVADAGWRKMRYYGSCAAPSCSMPSCSAPMYVVAPPPVCACCAPSCAIPSCAGPACGAPGFNGASNYQYGYGGLAMSGFDSYAGYGAASYGVQSPSIYAPIGVQTGYGGYGATMTYGSGGGLPSYPQTSVFGGQGYGVGGGFGYGGSVPSYYAPVSSQYTPVPPAPASDLVW